MPARAVNAVLGMWLFLSAFLWNHGDAQLTNTWVVGVLCILFSLLALKVPNARFLNTALAVWLFVSAFALPVVSSWTVWNNALVAITIFVLSLIGGGLKDWGPRRPQPVQ